MTSGNTNSKQTGSMEQLALEHDRLQHSGLQLSVKHTEVNPRLIARARKQQQRKTESN